MRHRTGDDAEANALRALRPGTYYAVVVGEPGRLARLTLRGFRGRVHAPAPASLRGTNNVGQCQGAGAPRHETALDCPYAIEPTRGHQLKGFMYTAAVAGPGADAVVDCANTRSDLRPLAGPHACTGFSMVLGPDLYTGTETAISAWYSLGNVDVSGTGRGDGNYYAAATGAETQLRVMYWNVELPF